MKASAQISKDARTVIVKIPLAIRKRGGRKLVVVPEGVTAWAPPRMRVDNTLVKAVVRAHRWRRLLEEGRYACISDLAKAERINKSYVCRVLRLALLAPDIVESILDGRTSIVVGRLLKPISVSWAIQRQTFAAVDDANS